jgi:hypothetical protein
MQCRSTWLFYLTDMSGNQMCFIYLALTRLAVTALVISICLSEKLPMRFFRWNFATRVIDFLTVKSFYLNDSICLYCFISHVPGAVCNVGEWRHGSWPYWPWLQWQRRLVSFFLLNGIGRRVWNGASGLRAKRTMDMLWYHTAHHLLGTSLVQPS